MKATGTINRNAPPAPRIAPARFLSLSQTKTPASAARNPQAIRNSANSPGSNPSSEGNPGGPPTVGGGRVVPGPGHWPLLVASGTGRAGTSGSESGASADCTCGVGFAPLLCPGATGPVNGTGSCGSSDVVTLNPSHRLRERQPARRLRMEKRTLVSARDSRICLYANVRRRPQNHRRFLAPR
jgi:hypothetical protein